jgi:hypothetical protein
MRHQVKEREVVLNYDEVKFLHELLGELSLSDYQKTHGPLRAEPLKESGDMMYHYLDRVVGEFYSGWTIDCDA